VSESSTQTIITNDQRDHQAIVIANPVIDQRDHQAIVIANPVIDQRDHQAIVIANPVIDQRDHQAIVIANPVINKRDHQPRNQSRCLQFCSSKGLSFFSYSRTCFLRYLNKLLSLVNIRKSNAQYTSQVWLGALNRLK
jgi:hypothetical protein